MSLIELLVLVAAASMLVLAAAAVAVPWANRAETEDDAVEQIEVFLQLARVEAARRDQICRFVLDTRDWSLHVFDSMGTGDVADDRELYAATLAGAVRFDRPDTGPANSLPRAGHDLVYQVIFTPRGGVPTGPGELVIAGRDRFSRVSVASGGDIRIDRWDGSGWRDAI